MGEAKRRRLVDLLGETRAPAFVEMMDDLEVLKAQAKTPTDLDRLTFMRLFSVALGNRPAQAAPTKAIVEEK